MIIGGLMSGIEFQNDKLTSYYGKHGYAKCSGFHFLGGGDNIEITPLTSRGDISRANYIQIPMEEIDNFINELQKFK